MTTIYLVYRYSKASEENNNGPEFCGAFSARDGAVRFCKDWSFVVCPAQLDEPLPERWMGEWPGAFWPIDRLHTDVELPETRQ